MKSISLILMFVFLVAAPSLAAQSADSSAHVRRGFELLALHQSSDDLAHATEAARAFAAAIQENSKDAVAHFGLATTLVNARKTMAAVRKTGVADGEALLVAKRSLEKALDLDPQYIEAASLLAFVAGRTGDRKAKLRALAIIPPAAAPRDTTAGMLARKPRTAVDYLRRASALYARGEIAAANEAYDLGLKVWDEEGAKAYVDDVIVIADRQEIIALTDGTLEKRAAALQTFWKKRAVRGGISIADRIAEHYRRLAGARARYAVRTRPTQHQPLNVFGKTRTGIEAELDDRGLIFMRYGEPSERYLDRALDPPLGARPEDIGSETWAYRDPDGRYRIYYFFGGRLEADLLRALSRGAASREEIDQILDRLSELDPRYARIRARMETIRNYDHMLKITTDVTARASMIARMEERLEDARRQNDRITEDNRETLFTAFDADAAYPRFMRPMTLYHDFATFRGNGCTDVVYSVAAPAGAYRLSVAIADTFTWETQSVDTVVMKGSAAGMYLRSTGVICTTPDYNGYVRFTAASDSVTGVTAGGGLRIPDYSEPRLMMSDLLFALDEDGPFVRGSAKLAIVPPRQFRQKEPFRLFYEIYNLPLGARYRTTLTFEVKRSNPIARLFRGNSKFTVSFEGEAETEGLTQEIRTLAPEIEDGEVLLTVKVENLATRETATNQEKLWILPADE